MAATLDLIQRDDFTSDIASLNLLGYSAGLQLKYAGYIPQVSEAGEFLWEALTMRAKGSSHDNLAGYVQAVAKWQRYAREFQDRANLYGVWLRAKMTNESNARQAFVRAIKHGPKTSLYGKETNSDSTIQEYGLSLERAGYWEATSNGAQSFSGLSTIAGTSAYTSVAGDVAARLANTKFRGVSGGGGPLVKCWLGLRSTRFGTPANFQAYWSLRKGTAGTDTTSGTSNADSTAKDGYKTVTTFATDSSLVQRIFIQVSGVTTNYNDQRGTYLVLMRAKVTGTAVCRVRIGEGLASIAVKERVEISSTSWQFYEMGQITIPSPSRMVGGSQGLDNYGIEVDAELASGSGNLEMDCLVMIPVNEGFVYGDNAQVLYSGGDERPLQIQDRANGEKDGAWYINNLPSQVSAVQITGGFPVGTGIVVVASQRAASSVKTDTISLTLNYYERWKELRGSS